MSVLPQHPRVLFVTPLAFNHFTGGGVTFSNLFRNWPKDRLFTVHADTLPLSSDTCVNYFALGGDELPLSGPLEVLRRFVSRRGSPEASVQPQAGSSAGANVAAPSRLKRLILAAVKTLFGNGGI